MEKSGNGPTDREKKEGQEAQVCTAGLRGGTYVGRISLFEKTYFAAYGGAFSGEVTAVILRPLVSKCGEELHGGKSEAISPPSTPFETSSPLLPGPYGWKKHRRRQESTGWPKELSSRMRNKTGHERKKSVIFYAFNSISSPYEHDNSFFYHCVKRYHNWME